MTPETPAPGGSDRLNHAGAAADAGHASPGLEPESLDHRLHVLILAGGGGTRLWPYSTPDRPKQLLPLVTDASMLRMTVDRLAGLVPPERMWILTGAAHRDAVRRELPDVPAGQVIGEPAALGSAAAVGLGAALLAARSPGAIMAVLTADHLIRPAEAFHAALRTAARAAVGGAGGDCEKLVTFGIRPTRAETGYGYIEIGPPLVGSGADPVSAAGAHAVVRFTEKPDARTAERFLTSGRHLWNSGMFVWSVAAIRAAFEAHLPSTATVLAEIERTAAADFGSLEGELPGLWARIEDRTTIDYGIMEASANVACVPVDFEWHDIGSWRSLAAVLDADGDGNVVVGRHVGLDTHGCLVFSAGDRLIATLGVDDLVVVDTGEIIMICPRDRAEEVRTLAEAAGRRSAGERETPGGEPG